MITSIVAQIEPAGRIDLSSFYTPFVGNFPIDFTPAIRYDRPAGGKLAEILESLREIVHLVTTTLGYPGILLLMLAENLFPPIPSEIVMPFAGFLVSAGDLHIAGVLLAGTLGSVLGGLIIYWLGVRLGKQRLQNLTGRYGRYFLVSGCDFEKAVNLFERYGRLAVLVGRLVPGVRSLISLPAGINQMSLGPFLLYTTIGTFLWNIILVGAGLLLGENWTEILVRVDTYEKVLWTVLAAVGLVFAARRLRRFQRTGMWFEEEC